MNRLLIISILIAIVITSCDSKSGKKEIESEQTDTVQVDNKTLKNLNTENTVDYLLKANEFSKHVLSDKIRKHDFQDIHEAPRHIEIFPTNGLERIVAFSNKDYPKSIEPNYYEHFTLFCLEYSNPNEAVTAFQSLRKLTETNFSEIDSLDQLTRKKVRFLHGQSKPGGLIVQKGKWIFSLVETCRNTPLGGSWTEYEDLFISFLKNDSNERIKVLNAHCGKMKYKLEER